ncbi:hypothetical protein PSTT_04784 [Puccinia striiformis]|uniref:Uncharacterized protein n=1 Tax=Puccinia striiformis TaxID=27350 RepID=A0A2S4VR11_9BASI|nr:hypothetical protein PSTT_04784 [Puccinia striiformis]
MISILWQLLHLTLYFTGPSLKASLMLISRNWAFLPVQQN